MKIALIGAMQEEISLLKSHLENLESIKIKNFTFFTGKLFQKNIILCQSGIGKVNASITTTLLIQNFSPDYIINTGSAGAVGKNLDVGDVIIGTHVTHHDADATAFGYIFGQIPQMPEHYKSDEKLVNIWKNIISTLQNIRVFDGLIGSADSFIADKNITKNLLHKFPKLQAVEMEAAAIAQTAHVLNVPFLIIRSISDNADGNAHISFDEFLQIAAKNSAKIVEEIVKKI